MNHDSGRCAAGQRIVGAFVQSENAVAVEYHVTDLETGARAKLGRELLDGEADRLRGAGKSSVAEREGSPAPSAPGGSLADLAPGGEKLSHGAVIKCSHQEDIGTIRL